MKIKQKIITLSLVFQLLVPNLSFAQQGGGGGSVLDDSLGDITTIFMLGGAGAILGLSTLSFADDPGEKTKNILIGGAIGIIIGVAYVAYAQATKTKAWQDATQEKASLSPDFGTKQRMNWHSEFDSQLVQSPWQVRYSFRF